MHGDEELGIPGHASHREEVRELQRLLSMLGVRYEAEGDVTRIHIDGLVVEVKDEPGRGVIIEEIIPLPGASGEDPEYYIQAFKAGMEIIAGAGEGFTVSYSVDEAAPGYPVLRATLNVGGLDDAYRLLRSILESLMLG
ncbi:MAG: hypothetical protein GSR86_08045 [Desulfurococcales archaeon]|nr:hypothetical protein [Desulfurococcales archaeon]